MDRIAKAIHLCFVYIPNYKGINDIEIVVDPHYTCHYDKSTKNLSIEKNTRIPDSFWGNGIHSVAAIVGNNGVGKSTAVEFILKAIVNGEVSRGVDGVFVYEIGGELYVYSKEDIVLPSGVKIQRLDEVESINCLYYSGHFIPDSADNIRCRELAGNYNISDGFLLLKDVQSYAGIDYSMGGLHFFDHLLLYKTLNHIRICRFLSDMDFYDLLVGCFSLKYVLIKVNLSGQYALKEYKRYVSIRKLPETLIPSIIIKHRDNRERVLTEFVYSNFLNRLFNDNHSGVDLEVLRILTEWQSFFNNSDPVLEQFDAFINSNVNDCELKGTLRLVHNALSRLNGLANFQSDVFGSGFFYLEFSSDLGKIRDLADLMDKSPYLVSRFFDLAFAQSLKTDTILSSGEQGLLDLLSRLYYTINNDCNKFSNLSAPALLILDEAEHSFHPEWQRQYLNLLFAFVRRLYEKWNLKFQILITTHSPLLLSDIPLDCVSFMKKGEDKVSRTVHPDFSGTFASNVFDLYRNSFFLDEGMVGAFAAQKISDLETRVNQSNQLGEEDYQELLKEIDLIGDIRIRYYLLSGLSPRRNEDEISYHMARIAELKKNHSNE